MEKQRGLELMIAIIAAKSLDEGPSSVSDMITGLGTVASVYSQATIVNSSAQACPPVVFSKQNVLSKYASGCVNSKSSSVSLGIPLLTVVVKSQPVKILASADLTTAFGGSLKQANGKVVLSRISPKLLMLEPTSTITGELTTLLLVYEQSVTSKEIFSEDNVSPCMSSQSSVNISEVEQ